MPWRRTRGAPSGTTGWPAAARRGCARRRRCSGCAGPSPAQLAQHRGWRSNSTCREALHHTRRPWAPSRCRAARKRKPPGWIFMDPYQPNPLLPPQDDAMNPAEWELHSSWRRHCPEPRICLRVFRILSIAEVRHSDQCSRFDRSVNESVNLRACQRRSEAGGAGAGGQRRQASVQQQRCWCFLHAARQHRVLRDSQLHKRLGRLGMVHRRCWALARATSAVAGPSLQHACPSPRFGRPGCWQWRWVWPCTRRMRSLQVGRGAGPLRRASVRLRRWFSK